MASREPLHPSSRQQHTANNAAPLTDLPNPKLDDHPGSNTEKDPDDWASGGDPITGAQASYLTTLAEEADTAPPQGLSKAEASKRIDALRGTLDLAGPASG